MGVASQGGDFNVYTFELLEFWVWWFSYVYKR